MNKTFRIFSLIAALSIGIAGHASAYSEREGLDIYQRGHYLEAIEYWKKAAAAGDAGSAYRLSEEYFDAKIVKRDLKVAFQYLQQAAKGNDARAITDLASFMITAPALPKTVKRRQSCICAPPKWVCLPPCLMSLPCWKPATVFKWTRLRPINSTCCHAIRVSRRLPIKRLKKWPRP